MLSRWSYLSLLAKCSPKNSTLLSLALLPCAEHCTWVWYSEHMFYDVIKKYAKYGGLAAVCLEWLAIGLFFVIKPSGFSGENTISYFATIPETRLIFSICLVIAATSFWIFTRHHLHNYYSVPVRVFALSMLGYGAMALMPYDPSSLTSDIIHKSLAMFFSVMFLAGMYLVGKNNKDTQLRVVSYSAVASGIIALLVFMALPQGSKFITLAETISAVVGQAWTVWITYHSFGLAKRSR